MLQEAAEADQATEPAFHVQHAMLEQRVVQPLADRDRLALALNADPHKQLAPHQHPTPSELSAQAEVASDLVQPAHAEPPSSVSLSAAGHLLSSCGHKAAKHKPLLSDEQVQASQLESR